MLVRRSRIVSSVAFALSLALLPWTGASASARLAGNVWTVDPDTSRVTIIDAGRRITFVYDAETIVRSGSTDQTIADLKRGDRVVVTLADDTPDALRARLIAIAGAPAGWTNPVPAPSPERP
jgi:hypothetical protein